MSKISGDTCKVTESECEEKVEEMTNGMIMVYNYSQGNWYFSKLLLLSAWHPESPDRFLKES
jgi:hypothetical protein